MHFDIGAFLVALQGRFPPISHVLILHILNPAHGISACMNPVKEYSRSRLHRAIIAMAVILVFGNTLFHQFTYDDHKAIAPDAFVSSLSNIAGLFTKDYFNKTSELSYRPVVTLTHFLEYAVWGQRPAGYHLVNICLHLAVSIALYLFLSSMTKHAVLRLVGTLLFAVHPVVCEPVNAISFREDLLAGLFVLVSFNILVFWRPSLKRAAIASIVLLAALFSKESALPFLVIPLFFFLHRSWRVSSKSPGFDSGFQDLRPIDLSFSTAAVLLYVFVRFFIMKAPGGHEIIPLGGSRLAAIMHSGFFFKCAWRLCVLPIHLNADYVFRDISGPWTARSIGGLAFLVLYLVSMLWLLRKNRDRAFFSLLWVSAFFLPAMHIIPLTNPFAERYLYLPLMGFAALAVCALDSILDRLGRPSDMTVLIACSLPLLILSGLSVRRNLVWSTDATLWAATLHRQPDSVRALNGAALKALSDNDFDRAGSLLREASELEPLDYELHNNLGIVYIRQGKPEEGLRELLTAVRLKPDLASAHFNLGRLYQSPGIGNRAMSEHHLRIALELGYPVPDEFSPANQSY